jgi:hypothetical protein
MPWVLFYVLVALAGLVVLAVLGWRVFGEVKALGREVAAAGRRIEESAGSLSARGVAEPPGRATSARNDHD